MFGDEATQHHFYNSCQFRCVSLLRMLKNAFWDKMPVPRACSVARFVIAQCNWDAMHAPCACSVVQFVLAQCTLGSDPINPKYCGKLFAVKTGDCILKNVLRSWRKYIVHSTFKSQIFVRIVLYARKPANLSKIRARLMGKPYKLTPICVIRMSIMQRC